MSICGKIVDGVHWGFISCAVLSSGMFWLNVDYPTWIWKLHVDSCRFCTPEETGNKGINVLKEHGAWMSFNTVDEAKEYFKINSNPESIWQPCKVCKPNQLLV